jgi:hypothetical protein
MTTLIKDKRDLQASVRQRHTAIQSANHETIVLLGVIPSLVGEFPARDAEDHEQALHARFIRLRRFEPHTCGAEWFTAAEELTDYQGQRSVSREIRDRAHGRWSADQSLTRRTPHVDD